MIVATIVCLILACTTFALARRRAGVLLASPYRWIARMSHDRHRTWGVVYDSVTKQPIDPAHVTVQNRRGVVIASAITDIDGRFGIIVPRGMYTLKVEKTNYKFPSTKLVGETRDGHYTGLYFGGEIEVRERERSIAFAIPMDPIAEDWNESEKARTRIGLRTVQQVRLAAFIYGVVGGAILTVAYETGVAPLLYLQIYAAALVIGLIIGWALRPRYYHSVVIEGATGAPLGFARVKVFNHKTGIQVASKTTSFDGQFVCLIPNGTYHVVIEKRDDHGAYTPVHTSTPFRVAHRSIGKRFVV